MSIRTRLTLWYTALLAMSLIALGIIAYVSLSFVLINGIDATLRTRGQDIVSASEGLLVGPGRFDIRLELPELDPFQKAGLYVQAWTVDGKLQTESENLAAYLQPLDPQGMPADQYGAHDVTLASGTHLRVMTIPLAVQGQTQVVGYLQIGTSLDMVDRARQALLLVLVPGGLLTVALSWFGGAFLARHALKPIDAITGTALQISRADDLSRRIQHKGPADEVGRLAGAFNHMLERLELLFGSQQRFVADISHELRTPLTTILGNLNLIRRMGPDEMSLDAIEKETQRMHRLVGDLMLLAQLDAGELPIRHEVLDLDTLLLEVYRQARMLSNGRVEVQLGQEDQVAVLGDEDRLRQLLLNLVDNAIKYTPPGGRVTLGLSREGASARVTVSDSGIGIPAADLPHIFDRFFRVDKARSRKEGQPGGAGLGLSIAQFIAQAHGGHMDVASEPGVGTTFSLVLPVLPEPAGAVSAARQAGEGHESRAPTDDRPAAAPS